MPSLEEFLVALVAHIVRFKKLVLSTKKKIIDELATRGIELIGPYVDSHTKATFKCSNNHIWESRANTVSCPACANYGFNPAKSAWSYAFIKENYIKYGITVDLNRRLREHRRNGELILIHSEFHGDGGVAREWENLVKNRFGGRFVTKEQCPDGWTETMGIDKLEEFLQFGKI